MSSPRLRICVYGSSSPNTPSSYTAAARKLGNLLAAKDHICVNGGGKFGCMGAVNDGADEAGGEIVGVIHSMFLVDGVEFLDEAALANTRHSLIVCGGADLTERKAKLVAGCDCIIVLPGGTGTWDEMWEMACMRNLGLCGKPIIAVSVDGFYDDFANMLKRASGDKLLANKPEDIVMFAKTAEEALELAEKQVEKIKIEGEKAPRLKLKGTGRWWRNALRKIGAAEGFATGLLVGAIVTSVYSKRHR